MPRPSRTCVWPSLAGAHSGKSPRCHLKYLLPHHPHHSVCTISYAVPDRSRSLHARAQCDYAAPGPCRLFIYPCPVGCSLRVCACVCGDGRVSRSVSHVCASRVSRPMSWVTVTPSVHAPTCRARDTRVTRVTHLPHLHPPFFFHPSISRQLGLSPRVPSRTRIHVRGRCKANVLAGLL